MAHFEAGATLLQQGDAAEGALLILTGRCRGYVEGGGHVLELGLASPGELVGELGLYMMGEQRSATVVALEEVDALRISPALLNDERIRPVMAVIERRALATLAERVRHNTSNFRRCEGSAEANPDADGPWTSGFMGALRRLFGG